MPDIEISTPTGQLRAVTHTPSIIESVACSEVLVHTRTVWQVSYSDDPNFLNPVVELDTMDSTELRRVTLEADFEVGRGIIAKATVYDSCGCFLEDIVIGELVPPTACPPPFFECPAPVGEATWMEKVFIEATWSGQCEITITGCPPDDIIFEVPDGDLLITAFPPEFSVPTLINPFTGELDLEGFAPSFGIDAAVPAGSIEIEGEAPVWSVGQDTFVSVGEGELSLDGFAPAVEAGVVISVGNAELEIETFAPTFSLPTVVAPEEGVPTGELEVSGFSPVVDTEDAIPTGEIELEGFAPGLDLPAHVTVEPGEGGITFTGQAPSVDPGVVISVPAGALEIEGFAPSFPVTDLFFPVPRGALDIDGQAPGVQLGSGAFFEDDFASGDLTKTGGGFSWGGHGGNVNVVASGSMQDGASPHSGSNALEFFYEGTGTNLSAELRMLFGDLSYLAYEYWLRVPSNYQHSASFDNRKFTRWFTHPDDSTYSVTTEYTGIDTTHSKHRMIAEQTGGATTENNPDLIGSGNPITLGTWHKIGFANQTASGLGNADGYYGMWVDDVLVSSLTSFEFWNLASDPSTVINRAYLFGAASGGFPVDTYFYVDEFKIYSSPPSWDSLA